MDKVFACPHCGQSLSVPASEWGREVECPTCGGRSSLPAHPPESPPVETPDATIFCTQCGQKNLENNYRCTRCGLLLHGPPRHPAPALPDNTFGGLIPYKNTNALVGYYLGIFSLLPCVGFLFGIVALVMGILGLRHAKEHPEAKGHVHAWVGVVLGTLSVVGHTLCVIAIAMNA